MKSPIGFVGLSHLGIIYSLASAADVGSTLAYDPNPDLVARLNLGQFPIAEPGLLPLFEEHRAKISYTSNVSELATCSIIFFALDVSTDNQNQSDLGPLRALLERVLKVVPETIPIVVLSQVNPGFTRALAGAPLCANRSIYYQVETLIFGRAVERGLYPERYIVGSSDPSIPLPEVYQQWLDAFGCPTLHMRYESAELAKIAINLFLVSSVTTTNTIAGLCEKIGADWSEIAPSLRLDARIGEKAYLSPGLGIAGGNLERDLVTFRSLANQYGADARVIKAWQELNTQRGDWVLRELTRRMDAGLKVKTIAVWGLAYKENTHSIKNSPSLSLQSALPQLSKRAYDPQVKLSPETFPNFIQCPNWASSCEGAEVLVIMTPWPEFRQIRMDLLCEKFKGSTILDPYGLLHGSEAFRCGFDYVRLGVS